MSKYKNSTPYTSDVLEGFETLSPIVEETDEFDEYITPIEEKARSLFKPKRPAPLGLEADSLDPTIDQSLQADHPFQFEPEQPSSIATKSIQPSEIKDSAGLSEKPVDLTRPDDRLNFYNQKQIDNMDRLKSGIDKKSAVVEKLKGILSDPELKKDPKKYKDYVKAYNNALPTKEIEAYNKIRQDALDEKTKPLTDAGLDKDVAEWTVLKNETFNEKETPPISMAEYSKELDPSHQFLNLGGMKVDISGTQAGNALGVIVGTGAGMTESAVGIMQRTFGDNPEDFAKIKKQIHKFASEVAPKNPNIADDFLGGLTSLVIFGGIGGATGASLKAMAKAGKVGQWVSKVGALSAMTIAESGMEAGSAYNEAIASGKSVEEAKEITDRVMYQNAILIGLTNKLGFFSDNLQGIKKIIMSAPMEGIQEGGQYVINQMNQGNPIDTDELIKVAGIGAVTGLFGGAVASGGDVQTEGFENEQLAKLQRTGKISPTGITEQLKIDKPMSIEVGKPLIPDAESQTKDLPTIEEVKKADDKKPPKAPPPAVPVVDESKVKKPEKKGLYQRDLDKTKGVVAQFTKELGDEELAGQVANSYAKLEVPQKQFMDINRNIDNTSIKMDLFKEEKARVLKAFDNDFQGDPKNKPVAKKFLSVKIDEAFKAGIDLMDAVEETNISHISKNLQKKQAQEKIEDKKKTFLYQKQKKQLTTKFFNQTEIKKKIGGKRVSPVFIDDYLKKPGFTPIEREVITKALAQVSEPGQKVDMKALQEAVETNLLPLRVEDADIHTAYGLGRIGRVTETGDSWTKIYNSPVIHGGVGHFGSHFEQGKDYEIKYVKEEDTYIAVEKNLPAGITPEELAPYIGNTSSKRELLQTWLDNYRATSGVNPKGMFGHVRGFDKGDDRYISELQSDFFKKVQDLTEEHPLARQYLAYKNTYVNRMVKEEFDRAIADGKKKLFLPFPRTLAYIEGYSIPSSIRGRREIDLEGEQVWLEDEVSIGEDITDPITDEGITVVEEFDGGFRAVNTDATGSLDIDDFAREDASNMVSEVEYEFEHDFMSMLQRQKIDEMNRLSQFDKDSQKPKITYESLKNNKADMFKFLGVKKPSINSPITYSQAKAGVAYIENHSSDNYPSWDAEHVWDKVVKKYQDDILSNKDGYRTKLDDFRTELYKTVPDPNQIEMFPEVNKYSDAMEEWRAEVAVKEDKFINDMLDIGEGYTYRDIEDVVEEDIFTSTYARISANPEEHFDGWGYTVYNRENDYVQYYTESAEERYFQYGVDEDISEEQEEDARSETDKFDISKFPSGQQTILKKYDKELRKAIAVAGYDYDLHTDEKGFQWYESNIEGKPRKPIEVFQKQSTPKGPKMLHEMSEKEVERELGLAKLLLPKGTNVELDPDLVDDEGYPAMAKLDLETNTIYINPNMADTTSMIHEVSHKATELLVRADPERARSLLYINGWDGRGDMMDFSNESTVDAWEAIAEKAESYYKDEDKFMSEEPRADWYKVLFDKLKHLWESTRNMLQRKGFVSESKFYDDLLSGNFLNIVVRSEAGQPGMLFSADEKNLLAYHNLTEANLRHIDRMGGIAMPSVAVSRSTQIMKGFGDISLIANKDLIDPKLSRKNKLGRADIYTSRYPRDNITYTYDQGEFRALHEEIEKQFEGLYNHERTPALSNIKNQGREDIENSYPLRLKYLVDNKKISPKDYIWNKANKDYDTRFYTKFEKIIPKGKLPANTVVSDYIHPDGKHYEEFHQFGEDIIFNMHNTEAKSDRLKEFLYDDEQATIVSRSYLGMLFRHFTSVAKSEANPTIDLRSTVGTWENKNGFLSRDVKYDKFIDDIHERLNVKSKLFKGHQPSGNRRYVAHTLENVVRDMKQAGGENYFYGVGSVRAEVTPRFDSVAQLVKEKKRLVSPEEFAEVKDEIDADFTTMQVKLSNFSNYDPNSSTYDEMVGENLHTFAKNGTFPDFTNVSEKVEDHARGFLTKLYNLPTEYFEAKIERAVGLEEFEGAIIPKELSATARNILKEAGITDIQEYTSPEERIEAFTKFRTSLFQRKKSLRKGSKKSKAKSEGVIPDLSKKSVIEEGKKKQPLPSINLDKINTEQDIQDLIYDTAKKHKAEINKSRREKVPNSQLKDSLKEMALTDKDIERIAKREPGGILNAELTYASRQVWEQAGRELLDYTKEIGVSPTDAQREQYQKLYSRFVALQKSVAGMRSEAGRLLQQWSVPTSGAGKDLLDNIIKETSNISGSEDLTDLQKLQTMMDFTKPTGKDKAIWLWYNLLLSNPKTDLANIVGNISHLTFEAITRSLSESPATLAKGMGRGLIEAGKGAFEVLNSELGNLRQGFFNEKVRLKEKYGAKTDSELIAKISDHELVVLKELERQIQAVGESHKFIDPKTKRLDISLFSILPFTKGLQGTKLDKIVRALTPTTRLGVEDAIFRGIARGIEETVVSKRLSKEFKKPIQQVHDDLKAVLQNDDLVNNNYSKTIRKYAEGIDRYVSYLVFQQDLGVGGKKLGEAINRTPLKMVIPFYRIAVNLAKVGINTTPAGLGTFMTQEGRDKWKESSPQERKHFIRRMIAGTMTYAGLMALAGGGDDDDFEITGSGPGNPTVRETWEQAGYKPYTIYIKTDDGSKIGIPYRNINPLNIVLSGIGDYSDKVKYETVDQNEIDKLTSGILTVATSLSDQSFMTGLSRLFAILQFRSTKGLRKFAVQQIPSRGVLGAYKTLKDWTGVEELDKTIYSAEEWGDLVRKQFDILETLPPVRTNLGKVRKSTFERFPYPTIAEADPVAKFLLDNSISVGKPSKKVHKENLNDKVYQKYVKVTGTKIYQYINKNLPYWNKEGADIEEIKSDIQAELREIRLDYIDKYLTK